MLYGEGGDEITEEIKIMLAIGIMFLMILSFAVQWIPASVTAVLAAMGMVFCGFLSPAELAASFGADAVIMVAGMMIVGNAVFETGLAERIGCAVLGLKFVVKTEKRFLAAILLMVGFLSAFMSNTASVAIFIPLVSSVAHASKGRIQKKNIFMAMGIISVLGGNCTLAGSTPQLIAQGILEDTPGLRPLTFFQLAYIGIPLVVLTVLYYATLGYKLQERCFDFEERAETEGKTAPEHDSTRRKQNCTALILLGCVIGFVAGWLSLGVTALAGGVLCILTGCISYRRAFEMMDWSTIVILAGALGFSKGLDHSGAVDYMAQGILRILGGEAANPVLLCAVLLILSSFLGNVMSHTATVAVLMPIAISIAGVVGVSPTAYEVAIIIGSSLAFATPIATPPLTMTLVGGYRFADYTKVGGALNIILLAAAILLVPAIYM